MEYKKTIILLALVVFLLNIAGVSASEIDNTIASENANTIELSTDNDIKDNLQTSEENEALASTDYDEAIAQTDTEVLGADSATYFDLAQEIGQPGNINLIHKNYTYDGGEPITISEANKVIDGNGAVIDMNGSTYLQAFYVSASGVTIKNLTIKNANYDGYGGAIYFESTGTVTNCNFTNNSATYEGGAVYFRNVGTVSNCNFTDNSASSMGGAVFFRNVGEVSNCNFVDNKATGDYSKGGAVYFYSNGTVSNCNFTDNTAEYGGAVYFFNNGNVTNCNFVDNKATGDYSNGGAVFFNREGTVTNCNFTNNSATYEGGAIFFVNTGTVSNCNFTGNNATTGSAIYFYKRDSSDTLTVSDSTFLNNRANAGALDIVKTENNITITFTGQNNLLNAIYSSNDAEVTFNNVKYWGADRITTVSAKLSGSNKAASQNITVGVVVNNELVLSDVMVTNESGMIVLDMSAGENYYISARHDTDSYYTEAERTISNNTKFNVNVTSQTTNNKTVNITAKSNIFSEVMPGKLLFILPNGTQINATYAGNGTWWAVHRFADYGFYQVNALYEGLNNVTVNKGILAVIPEHTFYFLNYTINGNDNPVIELSHDFYFDPAYDAAFVNGIVINRPVTIKGNGNAIDAKRQARIFYVQSENAVLENLTLKNAHSNSEGGAVYFSGTGEVTNCNFVNNTATQNGGAVYFADDSTGSIINCNFVTNIGPDINWGGAIYMGSGNVSNCNFINNTAGQVGGAIYMGSGNVSNCNFINNTAGQVGGAIYMGSGNVSNCNFTNNSATSSGGAIYMGSGNVLNCNFTDNSATVNGGAVYFNSDGSVTNCNFINNKATGTDSWGGAVYFYKGTGSVTICNFTDNSAYRGGAVYFYQGTGNVTNCNFINNKATGIDSWGGAVCFYDGGSVSNCNFVNNSASSNGGAVFFYSSTGIATNCNFTGNTASYDGGAVWIYSGTLTNCNFTGNNATTGSAIYFNSIYATKTVSNSRFLNNRANAEALEITKNDNNITITFTGRNNLLNAIYSSNDAEVTFTNVTYWGAKGITTVSARLSGSNKAAGQNITVGVVVNNELVLSDVMVTNESGMIVLDINAGENYYISARHNTDSYYTEAERTISNNTKFNVNVTSKTTNNKTVNITAKSNIPNDVVQGKLLFILPNGTQINATYGTNGTWWAEHTFDAYGEYKVNATYVGLDNVTINNGTITINKVNSTITLENIVLDYGETKNVTVTTTGATGITAKIDGNNVTVINNYTIPISGLGAGNYTLTVTTIPDDDHNPVTKEVNITVNKVNSTLKVNDIVFDYGSSGSTVVSLTGAYGVNATVVGQPKTVVKVNGTNITVSDLDAGTYTLTVTTIADKNHNNINKNATITVNKVNSTLTLDDVVLDYGDSKNVTVATEGATGITAKIDGVNVTVNGYTIPISGLGAGNYTLTVTTIPDDNHKPVNVTSKITVNKVESTLTVGDIVFDYDGEGSGDVSFTGASKVLANVVNQPSAVISISGNKIFVSGLAAGTYTLNVTTVPDENHTAVTETSTITVNKINSTLTLDDVELDYGDSKNVTVATEGATGITAKIDGVNVTVNGYTIPISGLGAGNYTLTVTTIPDDNHKPVNVTSKITVNKVESTLTVGDIVFDYDGEGSGDVSFTGASEVIANVVNQPSAVISISGNKISVSGLAAGTYTLNVTTVPDENHTAVTETSTITVNKINSTLTLDDVVLDYGDSKNVTVATEGATGITAKIDGVNVTVNGYTIPISGLGAGNYTLSVTTIPDDNHNPVTVTSKITVNKVESTLTVGDIVFDYGSEGSGDVSFTGASEVTANVINQPKAVVSVSGNKISVSGLAAGTYTLNVTTVPDENHTAVTETATITVNKVNSTLTLDDVVLDYGETKNITVTTEGATGITAKIDGVNVTVSNYTIPISGLSAGNYTLTVTTIADANHNNITKNATITVNKVNATLTVNDVVLDYGETKNITVTTEGATGITAKIDGVDVTVSNYTISISGLGAGNYTLTVTTIADKNHNPVTKEVNITVNKLSTEIILANETLDLKVGDEVTDLANLTPAGAGNLTLTSSDEDLVYIDDDGIVIGNGQGQAIITVSFAGNENYTAAENKTITVNVALNDASVSVENDTLNLKVDETSAINATIEPDTIMLKIKYTSSNESVVTVDKNGIVTAVGEGRAIITLEVGDDEIYAKNSTTVTVTVSKINTTADVSIPENIDVGDNVTVDVKLPSDATGNVTLKVDGKVIDNVQVTNGTASVKLPALGAGKHTVEVTYSGDDKYKPASKASTINVKKLSTKLSAADVKVTYSVNKYLLITLKDSKGDPLDGVKITVNLNGAKVYTTDSKGQVKIIVGKMVPKTYTAKITFAGNNKYLGSTASAKVVVQKANVRITALNKVYKSSVKVKLYPVILKDFTGKVLKNVVVSLKVNGKTYSAKTDANGKAIFKITQLTKKGTYNAVITFKGNNYYNKVVKKATIKVNSVWQVVQKGSKNSALVKKIQVALIKHGYYRNAQGNHLKIDGIYWDYTVLAVKQFQMNNHLKVTGKVDELTAKKLGII